MTEVVSVGAHVFRNHFGWYMQRAASGEEIHISKRGKPYVRLTGPPAAQPLLDQRPIEGPPTRGSALRCFRS